jgi:phage terminase large subunit
MVIALVVNMYFQTNADLFATPQAAVEVIQPWKPRALDHSSWPPDYRAVFAWRIKTLAMLRNDPEMLADAKAYYARPDKTAEFIMDWLDTYNPRKAGSKWMPFVLFARQDEFVAFLEELDRDEANGLVEKCRDIGATWLLCAYSVKKWLFERDDATGWGSRKQELVDKLGDPDSIFEKMRLLVRRLPDVFLPIGWKPRDHATFMKLINPENGSTITGESGDNIGRGGRKKRYAKDESAHYERAEKVEAALGDNTNVQIDISSVNGLGNVFHRKRKAGIDWQPGKPPIEPGFTRVFVFDWRDHPEKDQAWYDRRKAAAEREGMQHVFAQEVDRNYSAAVQNTIIDYAWIAAAVDAHLIIPSLRIQPPDAWMAGLDVADEGMDRNALALRQWVILRTVEEWGERDPGVTTRRMLGTLRPHKRIKVQYDSIGVGVGVRVEYNRLVDDRVITRNDCNLIPWNAGGEVVNKFDRIIPDDDQSLMNGEFFHNMKAQAWWSIRTRFYKTWRVIDAMKAVASGDTSVIVPQYPPDELISLDSVSLGAMLAPLMAELAQPTRGESTRMRMIVEKKPNGTRSPNLADAVIQCFFPAPETGEIYIGSLTA